MLYHLSISREHTDWGGFRVQRVVNLIFRSLAILPRDEDQGKLVDFASAWLTRDNKAMRREGLTGPRR